MRWVLGFGVVAALACAAGVEEGREAGSCDDGADNDGDGDFDCEDAGCDGSPVCAAAGDDTAEPAVDDTASADCSGVHQTGSDVGATPSELVGPDQAGGRFALYTYCDRGILVLSDATWNGAGVAAAIDAEAAWQDYGPDRLMVVVALGADESGRDPDASDLADYAGERGVTFPVVADPGFDWAHQYEDGDSIPFFVYLSPEVRMRHTGNELDPDRIDDILP